MIASLKITKDQITKYIISGLQSEGLRPINKIQFNIIEKCEGYGITERNTKEFDGATVDIEVLPVTTK